MLKQKRNSNLELYRIIVMMFIVAHHYVVNSGLMPIMMKDPTSVQSLFLYTFGMWGKTGINCFVLITGYFMCKSSITLKKFLKLLFEVEFYRIVIYSCFIIGGYETITLKGCIRAFNPINSVSDGFSSCFILFYLFIPFLNIFLKGLDKRMHQYCIFLCLFIYTVLGTIPKIHVAMNYVTWFCILYLISSYLRLYGLEWRQREVHNWGKYTLLAMVTSIASVWGIAFMSSLIDKPLPVYYFVSDSNRILAVITSICLFMYFKDLDIKYNRWINTIAASTFGVLLIHANSSTMRQWLWQDVLNNVGQYGSVNLYLHSVLSVLGIFVVCVVIDNLRIRFIEKPVFERLNIG